MKLTDFLTSRQHGLSRNISIDNNRIIFIDIGVSIELNGWCLIETKQYDDFLSKYIFPKNEEFPKTDTNSIRSNIPKPQILVQKIINGELENGPIIAMNLYKKSHLTGGTLLHLRSINKFEQMWLQYFINFNITKRDNPKILKGHFFDYCQSMDIAFHYSLLNNSTNNMARLRLLSFEFNNFILLMYVFDKNNYSQEELLNFINKIKSNT